ncbi:hypothetical protein J23TS9_13320 [Paenibacillus sp. J23TS9]|nr:hypothetical protein J23TS9_13320 [Paenibacillus sp. J23TS9]
MYRDDNKHGVNYKADAFIYWLNNVRFNKVVAELIQNSPNMRKQAVKRILF